MSPDASETAARLLDLCERATARHFTVRQIGQCFWLVDQESGVIVYLPERRHSGAALDELLGWLDGEDI
jgi:hypothetical protein